MKHKLLIAAAASALMAAPSLASAQDDGWYLRGNAGYGIHNDMDFVPGDATSNTLAGDVESEGNGAFSLGLGYEFGNNWRMELDGTSLWTDLGAIDNVPSSFAKLRTNAMMLNAIYDFSDFGRWEPYVGAGIGLVRGDLDAAAHDFASVDNNLVRTPVCNATRTANDAISCEFTDRDTTFGWQLLAGLGYAITDNLSWDTNYKYMNASNMDFEGVATNGLDNATQNITTTLEDVGSHSLMTGFRYRFGASAPAPVVAPAPTPDFACWDGSMVFNAGQCPAEPVAQPEVRCWDGSMVFAAGECPAQPETYTCWDGSLVYDLAQCPVQMTERGNVVADICGEQYRQEIIYYEFNKGQSAETRNTVNRILDIGEYCNVDNIRVVGHTDSSGSASYNLALSKRRAKDAMDELVRQGVDRAKITSEGKGETELFVQTGDGVKEQLNRHTEVLITLGSLGGIN
ncbi:OmpA family protein [Litorimonas sp. RW-G-Af-16]|uniref:OmpA family protein n=1 Tax=Litorimonas sp. RW-G-Af-16 TaxID=3241168 RepID=UPI003AAB3231